MTERLTIIAPDDDLTPYEIDGFTRLSFSETAKDLKVNIAEDNRPDRFSNLEHMWVVYQSVSGENFDGIIENDRSILSNHTQLHIDLFDFQGVVPATYSHLSP